MYVFTSITNNYLPKARVLAHTLKQFHPDWNFVVIISDNVHETVDLNREPFDYIIYIEQLGIPNLKQWIFKHSIMEICTAVKGPAAWYLAETFKPDKLIYLDPDIAVFNPLDEIAGLLDSHPIILTPHQTKPERSAADVLNNEVCFLKHGVYNLGFFAVNCQGQGMDFLKWYRDRLLDFCYIDFKWGLYTDQRWCDLVPVLFDRLHIHRDPGCNVARWNLSQRHLYKEKGTYYVDNTTLKFFHFSGYDSGQGVFEINRYIDGDHCFHELWDWYSKQLKTNGNNLVGDAGWSYDKFSTGNNITNEMRILYRDRTDLQEFFPDPYSNDGTLNSFENWYAHNFMARSEKPDPRQRLHRFIDSVLDWRIKVRNSFRHRQDFNK